MKVNGKNLLMMLAAASLTLGVTSCKKKGCTDDTANNYNAEAQKDDGSCTFDTTVDPNSNTVQKSGMITVDETWTADNIYVLNQKVVVSAGVTLTIMPGTIVMGAEGSGSLASALVVAQGGMLNACGTAAEPIIFTSVLDNIAIGETTGTNLDENDNQLWGGVLMLGYAPISAADGDVLSQIEGIPAGDAFGAFGGSDPADNSGSLCYVSIRHGGALIGAGNEINGLTLGGVGNGTSLNHIEVVGNKDDGIEFFGGTVNMTNALVSFQEDDGIDIDMNYSGTVSNFIVINGPGSDKALEIDGPEGSTYTDGMFTLENGSVYAYGGGAATSSFKSKAQGNINNVTMGNAKIRASFQTDCSTVKEDAYTHLVTDNTLLFNGTQFTGVTVYSDSDDGIPNPVEPTPCPVPAGYQTAAQAAMTSTTATGADASVFSWTWASKRGKL